MDFSQRDTQQTVSTAPANTASGGKKGKKRVSFSWMNLSSVVVLVSAAIVILALIIFLVRGSSYGEANYINKDQYQAVFLNGGQVYFGKIGELNSKYMTVNDIYYLRVNQTVQPNQSSQTSNDVSLVKLGCELHGPNDQMVINQDQVIFWENLKGDGQVAKAVTEYKKQNPNGQQCNTNTTSNSNSSTPTTNTSTTKKQ